MLVKNQNYITSAQKGSRICVGFSVTDEGCDELYSYTTYTCGTLKDGPLQGKMNRSGNNTSANVFWVGEKQLPFVAGNWTITIQVEDSAGNLSNEFSKVIMLY